MIYKLKVLLFFTCFVFSMSGCFNGAVIQKPAAVAESADQGEIVHTKGLLGSGYSLVAIGSAHYSDRAIDLRVVEHPVLRNDIVQIQQDSVTEATVVQFIVQIPGTQIGFLIPIGLKAIFSKINSDNTKTFVATLSGGDFKDEVRTNQVQNVMGAVFPAGNVYEVKFSRNGAVFETPAWFHIVENYSPSVPPTDGPPPTSTPTPTKTPTPVITEAPPPTSTPTATSTPTSGTVRFVDDKTGKRVVRFIGSDGSYTDLIEPCRSEFPDGPSGDEAYNQALQNFNNLFNNAKPL